MAVQDILQQMYGLTPENAQQTVNDTYRQQLMNDYLNTNLSSSNLGQAPDPNQVNFRQALFYNNFLKSEADRKAQEAAEKGGDDEEVRGLKPTIDDLYGVLEQFRNINSYNPGPDWMRTAIDGLKSRNDYDETLNYLKSTATGLQADYDGTGPKGAALASYIKRKPDIASSYQSWIGKANSTIARTNVKKLGADDTSVRGSKEVKK